MDASSSTNIIADVTTVATAILVNLGVLYGAWKKFKKELRDRTQEIKTHTDITVQKLNGMLSYVIHSADRPWWVKVASEEQGKTVFRMLEVNQAYTDVFGVRREDYLGKTDLEAGWKHEIADMFHHNDLIVWATGEPTTFSESIGNKQFRFRKVRLQTPDGRLKGVMGYMVDCYDQEGTLDIGKL